MSISGGIARKIEDVEFLYPAFHTELQLYNGGIGSSFSSTKRGTLNLDFVTSFTIMAGIREVSEIGFKEKFNPINYFSDLSATPLNNPFHNSIMLGSNYILSSDRDKEGQLIGIANLNIERTFQINYFNDGTPFNKKWLKLGDGYDRYYTGFGMISYYGRFVDDINHIELTYHKFTGYQKYAFESANHMQIDVIPYKNPQAFYYNQSRWRLRVGDYRRGYSVHFSLYDKQRWDIQDFIHFTIDNSYHPDTYHTTRRSLGIEYNYINWNSQ